MKSEKQLEDTHYIFCQTVGEHYIVDIEKSPNSNAFVNIYDDPANNDSFSIVYGVKNTKEGEMFIVGIKM